MFKALSLTLGATLLLQACSSIPAAEPSVGQTAAPAAEIAPVSTRQLRDQPFTHDTIVYDIPSERHAFHFTRDFGGATVHGSGSYLYRLVLQKPYSDEIEAGKPYAISHPEADFSFVNNEKKVFQGTTDQLGRTDVFAFNSPVDPDKWLLRLRTGSGPYGEQFVVKDPNTAATPGFMYDILVCSDKPYVYSGMLDQDGLTAYAATSRNGINLQLFHGGDAPQTPKDIHAVCGTSQPKKPAAKRK